MVRHPFPDLTPMNPTMKPLALPLPRASRLPESIDYRHVLGPCTFHDSSLSLTPYNGLNLSGARNISRCAVRGLLNVMM